MLKVISRACVVWDYVFSKLCTPALFPRTWLDPESLVLHPSRTIFTIRMCTQTIITLHQRMHCHTSYIYIYMYTCAILHKMQKSRSTFTFRCKSNASSSNAMWHWFQNDIKRKVWMFLQRNNRKQISLASFHLKKFMQKCQKTLDPGLIYHNICYIIIYEREGVEVWLGSDHW